jgi:uncharacterized membrane protein (DUF4010 family)
MAVFPLRAGSGHPTDFRAPPVCIPRWRRDAHPSQLIDRRHSADGCCISVATLAGLGIGFEREWSGHASGRLRRFAGVRTFMLLGLLSGIAGCRVSVSLVAVVLALGEKARVRAFVARIDDAEMRPAVQFALLALVVLPLLPAGSYGPLGGVRPRQLWSVVLLFSGLDFIGYVARRVVGPAIGCGLTGLLGGLVSSTALTLDFSRRSRTAVTSLATPLALGVVAACTVLLPRVAVITAILEPRVAVALVPYLVPPFVVAW